MKSFDSTWEMIHSTREWGKYPSEPVIRFVARNYYNKERNKIKILDFGCGAGANTWYLAREGFETYAFDGSHSAIDKVKNRIEIEGLKADLRVCDALELNFDNDFFDCVIDCAAICSNKPDAIKKMYEEIYNILKIGGQMFSTMFTKNTTGYGIGKKIDEDTYTDIPYGNLAGVGSVHFFDVEDIVALLHDIGFHDIQTDLLRYTDGDNVVEEILVKAKK